jgi:hypothetical protein
MGSDLARAIWLVNVALGAVAPNVAVAQPASDTPVWDEAPSELERRHAGERITLVFRAHATSGDPLTFTVRGLPEGAELRWVPQDAERRSDRTKLRYFVPFVEWTPRGSQSGSYLIEVTASDGKRSIRRQVELVVEEEWETFFMPGLAYSAYWPVAGSRYGTFHGPACELLFAGWIHRNDNRGPSHVRISGGVGLLSSTRDGLRKAVSANFGFDLSIERNPTRRFLLPFFGVEGGFLFQSEIGKPFLLTPTAGLHLWADRNLFVSGRYGYAFPSQQVDRLRGHQLALSVDLALW